MPPARDRSASRRSDASASGDREVGPASSAGAAASSSAADALGGRVDDPSRTRKAFELGGVDAEATRDETSGRDRIATPARVAVGGRIKVAIASAARGGVANPRGWAWTSSAERGKISWRESFRVR
jgi:hypothetical protein